MATITNVQAKAQEVMYKAKIAAAEEQVVKLKSAIDKLKAENNELRQNCAKYAGQVDILMELFETCYHLGSPFGEEDLK